MLNRRSFLQSGAACAAGAAAYTSGILPAAAQASGGGYKALVCLYLLGGMDHNDTVLPMAEAPHAQLKGYRSGIFAEHEAAGSSREVANLLALNPSDATVARGRPYGMPQELSAMRQMFAQGDAAIVGSVGPLLEPMDRTSYEDRSAARPPRLASHNDQQSTWLTFGVEGSGTGWGGRFLDQMIQSGQVGDPTFAGIMTGGEQSFLTGTQARPFAIGSSGNLPTDTLRLLRKYKRQDGNNANEDAINAAMTRHLRSEGAVPSNLFARDVAALDARGVDLYARYQTAVQGSSSFATTFPDTGLGKRFAGIARAIAARSSLGAGRQVFTTSSGGFDTHKAQGSVIGGRQREFSDAIAAFRAAMLELGLWDSVTVFTGSDFGRTLVENGDGTDHGWGGHHFVCGGAVRGGTFYGALPDPDPLNDEHALKRGMLIPKVATDQYAYTLGQWFGLTDQQMSAILPNIGQFAQRDLGFMSA